MQSGPSAQFRVSISKTFLIFTMFLMTQILNVVFAASTHQVLSDELLRDLQKNIKDSTLIDQGNQRLIFTGEADLVVYFNRRYNISKVTEVADSITTDIGVEITEYSLSLNRDNLQTMRNTTYSRQLELKVIYTQNGNKYAWRGRISDKLSPADREALVDDSFLGKIGGDYKESQPHRLGVLITTMSIFSLTAALFFIRT